MYTKKRNHTHTLTHTGYISVCESAITVETWQLSSGSQRAPDRAGQSLRWPRPSVMTKYCESAKVKRDSRTHTPNPNAHTSAASLSAKSHHTRDDDTQLRQSRERRIGPSSRADQSRRSPLPSVMTYHCDSVQVKWIHAYTLEIHTLDSSLCLRTASTLAQQQA